MLWVEVHRALAESFGRRTERETTEHPINHGHKKPLAEAKQVTDMLNVLWSAQLGVGRRVSQHNAGVTGYCLQI
jgi:hypothetical protein